MSNIAIRVENLSKRYQIGQRERYYALRDVLTEAFSSPFRRLFSREPENRRTGEPAPLPVSPSGPASSPDGLPARRDGPPSGAASGPEGSPARRDAPLGRSQGRRPMPRFPVSQDAQESASSNPDRSVSPTLGQIRNSQSEIRNASMPRFPVSPNPGHPGSQTQDRPVSPISCLAL